jgi:hypothetical protein
MHDTPININLANMDFDHPASRPQAYVRRKLYWLIGISICLHLLILFCFVISVSAPKKSTQSPPIKAKLIFKKQVVNIPSPPLESIQEEALTENNKKEITPSPSDKDVTTKPLAAPTNTEAKATKPKLPAIHKPNQDEVTEKLPPAIEEKPTTVTPESNLPVTSPRNLQQFFSHHGDSKLQELSEQAASEYQQQRKSPDLSEGYKPPPDEDDIEEIEPYQINCNTGVNSALPTIAKLLGGKIKCTKRNEFQGFIDKRVNKEPATTPH